METQIAEDLRAARLHRRMTQVEVAKQAGVTQAHVSMIERGLDAHLSVASRVADAVGLRLAVEPRATQPYQHDPYGDDVIANRVYMLARLAAMRVTPEALSRFRASLETARAHNGDYPYYNEWLYACDSGPDAVVSLLTDPTERGRYLRAVAPLRAFVSKEERDAHFRPDLIGAPAR